MLLLDDVLPSPFVDDDDDVCELEDVVLPVLCVVLDVLCVVLDELCEVLDVLCEVLVVPLCVVPCDDVV